MTDCLLVLKAKIQKPAGKWLADFCKDWQFIELLEKRPKDRYLLEVLEHCEPLFDSLCDGDSIFNLEKGLIDLYYDGEFEEKAIEVLVQVFLPVALIELEAFYYEIPERNTKVEFKFDQKKKQLLRSESELENSKEGEVVHEIRRTEEDSWEEEYGDLKPTEWRKNLLALLKLIADTKLQNRLFYERDCEYDFDPPYTEFEIWFDMHSYYMGRLNFEAGLDWIQEKGFLTQPEGKRIEPFDTKFQNFLPENLMTDDIHSIIEEPEWIEIATLAKNLISQKFLNS